MKEKVIKLLIKYGNNPERARELVSQKFDIALSIRPNASASKLAEIIICL